ncbi:MAG: methionine--tRNA ligase [Prevotella sp.]|nr:methionine--tRNA ligase [Prevotella sp.]
MENKKFKRTTVTAALPYANGGVHIGHLAGVYVPSDIYVRYLRLKKEDVIFIGGSDEHGVPITLRAKKEGCTPQDICDRYHKLIKDSFAEFGISFDIYSRTTSKIHHQFAADFFRKLYDDGKLVEQETEQYYDEEAHQFLADRYIMGTCPHCGNPGAYGDQCEKCGSDLSPMELIEPHSTISGSKPVIRKTRNWYLPLNEYQDWLKRWILEGHQEWRSNVYGQCKSWLDMDLQPRAMTRDLDWGIPVPVEGAEGKVLYVWFDAPIGYISNTKELCDADPDRWGSWQQWWQDSDTRLVHFIGKDNIVFHCLIFPTMLRAHGDYILPDNVPANEFLNLENDKISTSRNWAVWLHEYLVDFPGKQDVLRYVLTANAPETKDNNFTWKDFQERNNSELVAIYGNFVNRALQLTKKYWDGIVPACGTLLDVDRQAIQEFKDVKDKLETYLDAFKFREAQKEAMNLARIGNRYITECEPWKVWKTDPARVETILNISLQLVANLAIAFEPFLPFSSQDLRTMINMESFEWGQLGSTDLLRAGHQLAEPHLLFEKIEDDTIQLQLDKLEATKKANEANAAADNYQAAPVKDIIAFDEFEKLDIRVGHVKACEKVKHSSKLLRFTIDDGSGHDRTILSGIARYYQPEDLTGRDVLFIANLAPRTMMGIKSQGMILSAENADGTLSVTTTLGTVKPGSQVK